MSMTEVRGQDSAPSFTDPIAPLRIALRGHYEIERQIGQGAYATVYLARDLKHERKVAIKVLNADPTSDTGEMRFIREIRLVARLQHPNILPLHDSGHVEALLYYVMPFVDGETLRLRMHRENQMASDAAVAIARETADALAYAHKQGIVHRDIKPENILLSGGHAIVADFGIARAIDIGGVKQLTMTGVAGPGTPAYMSPEQLLGDRPVDARSDIYSLGCVLYEMLVARAPFPGKDGFVKRFTEPPPHISSLRRGVPGWIDAVVAKALAKDPSDRYATAADFLTALGQPTPTIRPPGRHTPIKHALVSPPMFASDPLEAQEMGAAFPDSYPSAGRKARLASIVPTAISRSQRWLAAARAHPVRSGAVGLGVLAAAVALSVTTNAGPFPAMFGGVSGLDSTRYVVIASTAADAAPDISSRVSDRLYGAFREWEGLPLVTDTRVTQAIADGRSVRTESDALSLARDLGAGRLVWGQASGTQGAIRVRIHLYDVSTGESRDEFLFVDSIGQSRSYANAALRLLSVPDRPRSAVGGDGLTKSFPAWSAYGRGHVALQKWQLADAEREFRAALSHDPFYSPGRVWLAQILAWKGEYRRGDWQSQAARAVAEGKTLASRELSIVSALAALGAQDFPRACGSFGDLTRADSLDFVGWHGLGECRYLDSLVVKHPASPSGWRFRSSYHSAALSYMRALRNEPGAESVVSFERLKRLLPAATTQVRAGKGPPPERALFVGYPGLSADSVVFVPYPSNIFQNLPRAMPANWSQALAYNARVLREFAQDWVRQSPRSPQAFEALADVLETSGELSDEEPGRISALSALRQSRAFASAPEQQLRVATREVWVNLKSSRFREARTLADSILDGKINSHALDPNTATGLAALTGRVERTAELSRGSREWMPALEGEVHVNIASAAARFFAYAALGVCGTPLQTVERALDDNLDTYVADQDKASVRDALKARPLSMIAHCDDAASSLRIPSPSPISRMQQAYARKDRRALTMRLDSAVAAARMMRPADLSFDYTYQLAWIRAASGDTLGALKQLQLALGALPSASTMSLRHAAVAAATVRAMVLCADLASATGDQRTAQHWARAVTTLWGNADPSLAPEVNRMRSLAAPTRPS